MSSFYNVKYFTINTAAEFPVSKTADLMYFGLELFPPHLRICKFEYIRKNGFQSIIFGTILRAEPLSAGLILLCRAWEYTKNYEIFTLENSASEAIPPNKNLPGIRPSAYCWFTLQSTSMLKISSVGVEINF